MILARLIIARAMLKVSNALYAYGMSIAAAAKADLVDRQPMHPVEFALLALIVGTGISGIWIGIVWRAAQ